MSRVRVTDAAAILALSTIVICAIAAPVLRAPTERIFGHDIVGRHHDPFTVMQQFAGPVAIGVHSQPITDLAGAALARVMHPVAAYNTLILLSFPLAALAAYLLSRHLSLSRPAAGVAAMAYAFSPFHLAHAAYHPHIAQTQWIPLYLLALWRCLDRASPSAIAFLVAAAAAVTLSNFYGGLIAAVVTPVAASGYWWVRRRSATASVRDLGVTIAALMLIAGAGLAYVWFAAQPLLVDGPAYAFPRSALFSHSASWWSFLVPPAQHPLAGASVLQFWSGVAVSDGLLEQQVTLGWAIIALGVVAVAHWTVSDQRSPPLGVVPLLSAVATIALLCSLSPERTIAGIDTVRPSAALYTLVPMFRSYARFGVVVQLMAVLLAGIGLECLRRRGARSAQIAALALLLLAIAEYAVAPSAMSRDVLPTPGHRWLMQQTGPVRAVDCTPVTQESASVSWLTAGRITPIDPSTLDCDEPDLAGRLAATAVTHLLVRRTNGERMTARGAIEGLPLAAAFDAALVYAVAAPSPAIYVAALTGAFPREHDAGRSWRWMGSETTWIIANTTGRAVTAALVLELSPFPGPRRVDVLLDGAAWQSLTVEPSRRTYELGPMLIGPDGHAMTFRAAEPAIVADRVLHNGDPRALSVAFGNWRWIVQEDR